MQQTIETILNTVSPFLYQNFDIKAPETKIEILPQQKYQELIKKRGLHKKNAFYDTFNDTLYLTEKTTKAEFIHEYYGHALFLNNTERGQKTLNYIEKIKELSLEKTSIEDIIEQFPKTSKENKLATECFNFFEESRPLQEGFALFMEYFILGTLKEEELWQRRIEEIKKEPYFNNLVELAYELENKGPLTAFYKVGFPISKKTDMIKRFAAENIKDLDKVIFLIQYGSLSSDIDFLAVYRDDHSIEQKLIYDHPLDLNKFNISVFLRNCALLDVEITEAVLHGNLLMGHKYIFDKIKTKMQSRKPSKICLEFMKRKALETYNYAKDYFNTHRYAASHYAICNNNFSIEEIIEKMESEPDSASAELFQSLQNLSFSLSYNFLSSYYKNNGVTSFQEILKQYPLLKELRTYIKDVKKGRKTIKESKAVSFFERAFEDIKSDRLC